MLPWTRPSLTLPCETPKSILVHSSLLIWEELRVIRPEYHQSQSQKHVTARGDKWIPVLISFLSIFLVCLLALWWLMLLMTSLYFHSFDEKALGLGLGLGYWLLSYGYWAHRVPEWSPTFGHRQQAVRSRSLSS